MKQYKRIFLIVMDSLGVGYLPDANQYGDEGANTLKHILDNYPLLKMPNLTKLGIYDFIKETNTNKSHHPNSVTAVLNEMSKGKDTITGHWEMMGVLTNKPFISFTDTGFPKELINELENRTGYKVIGNKAASGTEIIKELGEQQLKDKSLIVYTSADSVLQIAMHEELYGLEEIYRVCQIARDICMKPEWKVGRIIARPYIGTNKDNFVRTANRHDYAVEPPIDTVLNSLSKNGINTYSIGKIFDIFSGSGIDEKEKTISNHDGMVKTIALAKNNTFEGFCFVNLVEFDSQYGHRRDPIGYAKCIEEFDIDLGNLLKELKNDDLLILTADHGNDPTWTGTDHTREKVPFIAYSKLIINGRQIKDRDSFSDIGITILSNYHLLKDVKLIGRPIEEVF